MEQSYGLIKNTPPGRYAFLLFLYGFFIVVCVCVCVFACLFVFVCLFVCLLACLCFFFVCSFTCCLFAYVVDLLLVCLCSFVGFRSLFFFCLLFVRSADKKGSCKVSQKKQLHNKQLRVLDVQKKPK